MITASVDCEVCGKRKELTFVSFCNQCAKPEYLNAQMNLSICPVCGSSKLYRKKNFNQTLGCLIIIIGAILVPFTYGLSLVVLSILDFILYRRVKDVAACYKCQSEFMGLEIPSHLKPFNHHTAELFEKP